MSREYELRQWDWCAGCGERIPLEEWEHGDGYCDRCWQLHNEHTRDDEDEPDIDDTEYWLQMRREGLGYPGWIDDEFPEEDEEEEY